MSVIFAGASSTQDVREKLDCIITELRELRLDFRRKRDIDNKRWDNLLPVLLSLGREIPLVNHGIEQGIPPPILVTTRKRRASDEVDPPDGKRLRFA